MNIECRPQDAGLTPQQVDAIWFAACDLYSTGLHPALTLCLRRNGKVVLNRALGNLKPGVPMRPEMPVCLFSASKAISALLVHKLVEMNKLDLDDRISDYIPEFAPHGKDRVTVRQLLAHRAGIPTIMEKNADPALLFNWDAVIERLCAAKPFDPHFERQSYHAITGGFIVGELVRRVSGLGLREALARWIAEPLGCTTLDYGLKPGLTAPPNSLAGQRTPWLINKLIARVLGGTLERCVEVSNDPRFASAVIPAGNIYANADDACRVYQMLLNGGIYNGVRVFKEETIAEAVRPTGPAKFDGMLLVPVRFSAGFWLGERRLSLYGLNTPHAYGHMGFINIAAWADPQRGLSCALLTTGKSLAFAATLRFLQFTMAVSRECPPMPDFRPLVH